MFDTQILTGIVAAVAALAGLAIVLAVAFQTAAALTGPGKPNGGIRRDQPQLPQPDADRARELVLR